MTDQPAGVLVGSRTSLLDLLDEPIDAIGGATPPADGAGGSGVPLVMQAQEQSEWCRAAVAVSVATLSEPDTTWTQCGMVDAELGQTACCLDDGTANCNRPGYLDRALNRTGHLREWRSGTLSPTEVTNDLRQGRPVALRIGWTDGAGHFVVLIRVWPRASGWFAEVADPSDADRVIRLPWDELARAYDGIGRWTHTYLSESRSM